MTSTGPVTSEGQSRAEAYRRVSSPAVLSAMVAVAVITALLQSTLPLSILRGLMVLVLVPCALIDLELRIIPNRITGPAALVAVAAGLVLDAGHEPRRLLWAAIAGAFLLVAALIYPAGMGMGDVKLLAVMGLFLGSPVIVALLLALLASIFSGLFIARRRGVRAARKSVIPFGPYLALGGLVAALVGTQIVNAYVNLHH